LAGQIGGDVGPWLRSTVRHKAIDWVRARARERGALADLAQHPPDGPPDPAQAAERGDTLRHILVHLADLPERERRVIELTYIEEKTCDEIAEVLGIHRASVTELRRRAIARLRTDLGLSSAESDREA